VRRKFYEIYESNGSPVAAEALARICKLCELEEAIRGRPPEERCTVRKEISVSKPFTFFPFAPNILSATI
jgi:transposase